MKTKIAFILSALMALSSMAQNGINYKAVVKDGGGNIIANDLIQVNFKVLKGVGQTNVYEETHSQSTDANGLIALHIGEGTPISGDFLAIDWASDTHFLNLQINTGSGPIDLGTTQFMAVPYALNALSSSDNHWSANGSGINTSNNVVGINSAIPEHTLDVRSSSQTEASQLNISNSDKSRYVRFFSGSEANPDPSMTWVPGRSFLFASFDDNTLAFNEYMRISTLGDVGIGINNPEAKLDIAGGDWNLDAGNPGDFRIGNTAHNFRIGVATGGGGAGITRMYTNSNALFLGTNDTPGLILESNGEIKVPELTISKIESAGDKSLITKEYADATYSNSLAVTKEIMIPPTSFDVYNTSGIQLGFLDGFAGLAEGQTPIFASIILPVGATITEISVYLFVTTANDFGFQVQNRNLITGQFSVLADLSTSGSSGQQVLTSTTPIQITSNHSYFIAFGPITGSGWSGLEGIEGVKIKYTE